MLKSNYWCALVCAFLLILLPAALPAQTEEGLSLQSDWMELVKGQRDSELGAEVRDVGPGEEAGTQKITLSIPKASVGNRDDIEEVLVVGRRPEKFELPLKVQWKWLDDYDNDNYGLVIYLSEDSNWPIRLYLNSEAGFLEP
jgi:hypothetical protein